MNGKAAPMRRDMLNDAEIRDRVASHLEDSISPAVSVSSRHNAAYGLRDFNAGMAGAAVRDASVGGTA